MKSMYRHTIKSSLIHLQAAKALDKIVYPDYLDIPNFKI